MRQLYYFTTHYPKKDIQWKTDEIKLLKQHFTVHLVPFSDKVFSNEATRIKGVTYYPPLFQKSPKTNIYITLLRIFFCRYTFKFLKEFWRKKVYLSKAKLILWAQSAFKILMLSKNNTLKKLFKDASSETIFYFYWGRESSEALGFLKTKAKIIVRFHGYDLYEYRHKGNYIPFRTTQLKALDFAVFVSEDGYKYLHEKYSHIDFNSFVSRLGTKSLGKAKQSTDGIFRIVSCSSVIPLKRVDLIAKAVMKLDFKTEWIHIGGGSDFEKIKNLIKKSPENISITLAGQKAPHEIPSYYVGKPVDVFINVSTTEGLPVSIMEAFAASIPTLATNVGGTSELVSKNTGELLNPNINAVELSNTIAKFRQKTFIEKQQIKENAYHIYMQKINFSENCENFISKIQC